jgi:hypothetical protein
MDRLIKFTDELLAIEVLDIPGDPVDDYQIFRILMLDIESNNLPLQQ